jgi:hypothetical protein
LTARRLHWLGKLAKPVLRLVVPYLLLHHILEVVLAVELGGPHRVVLQIVLDIVNILHVLHAHLHAIIERMHASAWWEAHIGPMSPWLPAQCP